MSVGAGAIRAGLAVVELAADAGPLMAGLNKAAAAFKGWASKMTSYGAALGGLGASIAGPILASFKGAVEGAAGMDTLATQLNLTVEKASALTYALGTVGISEEELVGFTKHLSSAFASAADGSHDAVQSFSRLGLDWQQLAKIPLDERLVAVSEALKRVGNDFDRSEQAAHFFGRRGQELLKLPTGELQKRMAQAADVGAVVTAEQAAQAKEIQRAFGEMSSAIKYAFLEVGRALLPHSDTIREYARYVVTAAGVVRKWVSENKPLVVGVLAVGAALTAAGAALVALGVVGASVAGVVSGVVAAGSALAGVLGAVGAAIGSGAILLLPVVLAAAAIQAAVLVVALAAVGAGIAALVYYWDDLKAGGLRAWSTIVAAAKGAWATIQAVAAGAWSKVRAMLGEQRYDAIADSARAAWGRVKDVTSQAVADGARAWTTLKETAQDSWGGVVSAVKRGDLQSAWGIVAAGSAVAWQSVKAAFLNTWDEVVRAAMDGWGEVVAYLDSAFSGTLAGIITTFAAALKQMLLQMAANVAAVANTPAARMAGLSGRLSGLSQTLAGAGEAAGQAGGGAADWAQERKAKAQADLDRARAERAAADAGSRDRREAAVNEARERLKAILDEEKAKAGAGGAGGAGAARGPELQQAAREVRGTFGAGLTGSASAQQALAVGSTPGQRQLVDLAKSSDETLKRIEQKVEAPAAFG